MFKTHCRYSFNQAKSIELSALQPLISILINLEALVVGCSLVYYEPDGGRFGLRVVNRDTCASSRCTPRLTAVSGFQIWERA